MNLIKKNYGFKKINSQRKKDAIKINELNKITKINKITKKSIQVWHKILKVSIFE